MRRPVNEVTQLVSSPGVYFPCIMEPNQLSPFKTENTSFQFHLKIGRSLSYKFIVVAQWTVPLTSPDSSVKYVCRNLYIPSSLAAVNLTKQIKQVVWPNIMSWKMFQTQSMVKVQLVTPPLPQTCTCNNECIYCCYLEQNKLLLGSGWPERVLVAHSDTGKLQLWLKLDLHINVGVVLEVLLRSHAYLVQKESHCHQNCHKPENPEKQQVIFLYNCVHPPMFWWTLTFTSFFLCQIPLKYICSHTHIFDTPWDLVVNFRSKGCVPDMGG